MADAWYVILAGLVIGYAVLDGFDLGAGVLHLVVARTDAERRVVLNSIGPVWDGNEVWLIAWGASLFLAFPRAFAVGFSGFYLPLMIALWLLMGRGVAVEFRHHFPDPLWRAGWDAIFCLTSLLLAVLYGVAVGNVITGAPIDEHGYFQGLFQWMLNPYALLMGVFSLAVLTLHGAHFLCLKSEGALQERASRWAGGLWPVVAVLALALTAATFGARPELLRNFAGAPALLAFPGVALLALVAMRAAHRTGRHRLSFLASSGLIGALLASTAAGSYPYLLVSTPHPERSLTVMNSAAGPGSLAAALGWIGPGILLLILYQVVVYRVFAGKVALDASAHY
jgi:cytochrome d ubiquinol oxidase subunit II